VLPDRDVGDGVVSVGVGQGSQLGTDDDHLGARQRRQVGRVDHPALHRARPLGHERRAERHQTQDESGEAGDQGSRGSVRRRLGHQGTSLVGEEGVVARPLLARPRRMAGPSVYSVGPMAILVNIARPPAPVDPDGIGAASQFEPMDASICTRAKRRFPL
jgi:hypothetical protein